MKPWVGAVAAAAAILAAPSVALAGEDDPAQLQFKLPSKRGGPRRSRPSGYMDHNIAARGRGQRARQRVGHRRAGAAGERTATRPSARSTSKYEIDRIRAERNRTLAESQGRQERADGERRAASGARASLPGTVRAQRADYWENNVGRYLSIEARRRRPPSTARRRHYIGPPLIAESTTPPATGSAAATCRLIDDNELDGPRTSTTARGSVLGLKSDGGPEPASVKVAALERRRRHARRQAVDRQGSAEDDRRP